MAKILLIDDEPAILKSIGTLLESEGHEIVPVNDGNMAVDAVRAGDYELIITDIRMAPIDGMQILRFAHEAQPTKPLIVISAYSDETTVRTCMELGCTAYIRKPFKVQEIQDAVEKALGKR